MTSTKTSTTTKPDQDLQAAQEAQHLAEAALSAARAHVDDLTARVAQGDGTVKSLELFSAEGDVRLAEGLLRHTTEVTDAARGRVAALVAEEVARDVAAKFTPDKVDERVDAARHQVGQAITSLIQELRLRDSACDAAGQRLAAAGVPQGQQIGRLHYTPVTTGVRARVIPGRWNLSIEGEPVVHRDGHDSTRMEGQRLVQDVLTEALGHVGLRWGATGVEYIG